VTNIRVVPLIMPYVRIIPAPNSFYHVFEVPEDDTSTATYIVIHGYSKPNVREIMRFWRWTIRATTIRKRAIS